MYEVIVHLLREFSEQPSLVRLLAPLPGQAQSLHGLLLGLESQAASVSSKIGHHQHLLTRDFLLLSHQVTEALKTEGLLPVPERVRETSSSGAAGEDEGTRYRRALSGLQYDTTDFTGGILISQKIFYFNFLPPCRPPLPEEAEPQ